ncbi:MAG: HsdR family type I site-specific deoxyribonuclease [Clostridium sp.]|jgi:type I restriction enzyme R subunit|uniref:type I restriction endonuclease subunit R n=1 Tax=Clostridium sp. TaxID=1506 RepID=UPI0025BA1652|nr:HsdR family type I site-specific deoxyribonuclease [Clostridium sp.]MCH3964492.1 HsdR family type I site-specific deoxyribonuclease [Clostridium sp.]MCI1714964.1 HsdR family type I site-specific deoxyribonuclease [Clostridium sp.]MCI1799226.1 HsdR family type I site-specific deoxyribonuclease [Clostridium sp.]MCI1813147.1 HsdR family type I site-specific deoxyribonuclease [Clostridium sp.]MCI1870037.1 HsdR family type I site-specific deoxyribonuclease [Clostridium sp.]
MNEEQFESELIQYITSGTITKPEHLEGTRDFMVSEKPADYCVKTKLWKYESEIKTTEKLWDNFKEILERHNQNTLDHPLSIVEFNQVKKIISDIQTPYEAGQFLYGLNGVSQIEIDLDDGRHVFLTVFDQKQIGAGDTVYQVVNQIGRPAVIAGKQNRRFDTTLLINGLPIIQIEEKRDTHDVNEALNQMHQYSEENQYGDIFSTLQILVAITPNNVKYMANTTPDKFNKDFAFNWQRKSDNTIVRNWKEFADSMLSIPMAHQMATNYMILDGTKNKQMLKVMRPYQVYATQNVIEKLKQVDFELGTNKVGYVWHTTGSGKTITSFKTAWLASRMPKVDKVVFVVDRIALTKQTNENYRAYDPDAGEDMIGSVQDTNNTTDLSRKLKSKDNSIIVTSVQKLDTLVKRKSFKAPDKNIVFIVDEAHRSTGGESFAKIQKAFRKSAWVGYTGTPMFDETTSGLRTKDIFGPLLHAYTIREAIADRNVLGFKVDFETTIDEEQMKTKYLPNFYRERYSKWTERQIKDKINNLSQEDMDDAVEPSFYDENPDHIKLVVEDIFKNWRNRSNEGRYNALFTTHVGGGKASTPMAMMYFNEFQRVNDENRKSGGQTLKVAVTFSQNASNNDSMLAANQGLYNAMEAYNKEFGTSFGMDDAAGYTQDVTSRLNKTATDKNFLDIVIVVDQLLTGFDAPELNTLYVDRTLKGAGLIQAYSRTNRIADMQEKPWGRIINYRWPAQNEKLMNEALAIYANKDSAILSENEQRKSNQKDGIIAKPFEDEFNEVKKFVEKLDSLTNEFQQLPYSEKQKEYMFDLLRDYNAGMAKLKQYTPEEVDGNTVGFNYDNPDELVEKLGMTSAQETMLTTVLTNELKQYMSKKKKIPFYQIELKMTHVKDVKIDYDYLTELVEQLLNQVHEGKSQEAQATKEKIDQFATGLEDRNYAVKVMNAAIAIIKGHFPPEGFNLKYPVKLRDSEQIIQAANNVSLDRMFLDFRVKWGITDIITSAQMRELFSHHRYGMQDLDDAGQIRDIIAKASVDYKTLAHDEKIQSLSKIKYRNGLRKAIYELADEHAES